MKPDVVWKCSNEELHCHKVILAAQSKFLRELLVSVPERESTDMQYIMTPQIDSSVVRGLLDLFYSGEAKFDVDLRLETWESIYMLRLFNIGKRYLSAIIGYF